jgi:hypothetical protein
MRKTGRWHIAVSEERKKEQRRQKAKPRSLKEVVVVD